MKILYKRFEEIASAVRFASRVIREDKITVYAAQASFFIIISAVPFLSLLLAAAGLFIPENALDILSDYVIPQGLESVIGDMFIDIREAPNVSLFSLSAVTTLWTASKGSAAVRTGLEAVYRAERRNGFFLGRMRSLAGTLVFMLLIIVLVAVLLFGSLAAELPWLSPVMGIVMNLRFPIAFALMSMLFAFVYYITARRSKWSKKGFVMHLPGAVFASAGWLLFSFFYSLYISRFPDSYYVYGSLAAVCMIMLWIYFCTIILLLGAQVNRIRLNEKQTGTFE